MDEELCGVEENVVSSQEGVLWYFIAVRTVSFREGSRPAAACSFGGGGR
jgi:hypothetical protein